MYSSTLTLNLALDGGGKQHAPSTFPLGKTWYTLYRGWVGPTAGLYGWGKSRPYRHSSPGPSSA